MASFTSAVTPPAEPFEVPVLGTLRGRRGASTTDSFNETLYFSGDLRGLLRLNLTAEDLRNALVRCFRARGIEPRLVEVVPQYIIDRASDAMTTTGSSDKMRGECAIAVDFNTERDSSEKIQSALAEIVRASREIERSSRGVRL